MRCNTSSRISVAVCGYLVVSTNSFTIPSFGQPSKLSSKAPLLVDEQNDATKNDNDSSFAVGILGDLHIDPRYPKDYKVGRSHWLQAFEEEESVALKTSRSYLWEIWARARTATTISPIQMSSSLEQSSVIPLPHRLVSKELPSPL